MSDNNFNSNLDAILAEFASYSDSISGGEAKKEYTAPAPAARPTVEPGYDYAQLPAEEPVYEREELPPVEEEAAVFSPQDENASYYVDMSMLTDYLENRHNTTGSRRERPASPRPPKPEKKPRRPEKAEAPRPDEATRIMKRPAPKAEEPKERFSPAFKPSGRDYTPPVPPQKRAAQKKKPMPEPDVDKVLSDKEMRKAQEIRRQAEDKQAQRQAQRSAINQNIQEKALERDHVMEQRRRADRPLMKVVAFLFAIVSLFSFAWVAVNVHPDSGTSTAATVLSKLDLTDNLDVYLNNAYADALSGVTYIKKIYTIPESATVAPAPNPAAFGETTDPAVIEQVIADAAQLLDGQKTLWSRDIQFYPGTTMQYYRDDSILVITWKEIYDERCCTMAEVKVAHGSQFRRRLAEDSYSSSVQFYSSEMAKASNAVVASNADFYAFRTLGVTVYQRQLFRAEPGKLDTCFITASGDMLFSRAGELMDAGQINRFVQENDVLFSLSFGPVLVDNSELQYCPSYPIGEIDTQYSRAGIGMLGDLHYLLMTVNHTDGRPRANVNQFGQYMYEKGCIKAYNLDGGQTSEIVMNGKPVNYIDFGAERTVSDIIYFASALPESEWRNSVQTEVTQ